MASILMQVQVPIVTNEKCKKIYRSIERFKVHPRFDGEVICVGFTEGGKDSCQGDSGGPVMLPIHQNGSFPFFQIGVISFGVGCAKPNVPSVNTNVAAYAEWIEEKLKLKVK